MSTFIVRRVALRRRIRALVFMLLVPLAYLASEGAHGQADSAAVDELERQAQVAMSKGQPGDAVSILRKAIEAAPDRAELYLLRSRARDSSGKSEAALQDATKFIELQPDDAYGYLNRARIYLSLERPAPALEDTNKAIALAPEEPDAYYRRADVYLLMNKEAEAKADEARAQELERKLEAPSE